MRTRHSEISSAYLKTRGWYQNALIIVVGDHGEGPRRTSRRDHGIFLYDSTTHVPLIVKLPGQATTKKLVEAQVRTTDILPTVLDLLGVPPPARLDGESLKAYFAGNETASRTALEKPTTLCALAGPPCDGYAEAL